MSQEIVTFDDMPGFIDKTARHVAYQFRRNVEYDDVSQELYAWLYGKGRTSVIRWLSSSPQQVARIYFELGDRAVSYAQKEKALQAGYEVDDLYYYSPFVVEELIPMAMDPNWKPTDEKPAGDAGGKRSKPAREGGDLVAMVMDVRMAGEKVGWNVESIVEWLGGRKPRTIGRRKAISNAQALAMTGALTE